MKRNELNIGNRVLIKSIGIKGTISYIDIPTLSQPHCNPIQIDLDESYPKGDTGSLSMVHRTNPKDLKPIVKGRKKNAKK